MERLNEINLEELLSDMRCLHAIRSMEHNHLPYRTHHDDKVESLLVSYKRFKQDIRSYIRLANEMSCNSYTTIQEDCSLDRALKRKTRTEDAWQNNNNKDMKVV